ncbi:4'-phosphopantetheinyl transferase family protein [Winogradskyella sp. SM1960]|uniref:4'-phosphopantetheinyl transferase family protein n=1 Tax=Winogradskyella sp. SM1960 TaxID=2865955 RepID=UPI001CD405C7|nr:4'-phosphopantetheinyl transferase superfamily protein [Winogradskyella sp. SM1960]
MDSDNFECNIFSKTSEIVDCNIDEENNTDSDIKLFKIELPKYYGIVDVLLKRLTSSEIQRAERYRLVKDKNRFVICRSILKFVLAKEKQIHISEVQFEKNSKHKPYLKADKTMFFNVSHAGDYAIIAIGKCDLGVDIEYISPDFNYMDILPSVFSDEEISFLQDSKFERQIFYKFWTRKEAIVKAIGKGIDDDFLKIPVLDGAHTVPSRLVNDFKKINVFSFNLNANYVGALAFKGDKVDFKKLSFQPLPNTEALESMLKL